ncbi:MAG: glycosyltransferase [Candidatus Aenigmatarchaeota archaeon]
MLIIAILWFIFAFLSFGVLGLAYLWLKRIANKPWNVKVDKSFTPKVSIIVPTYNEEQTITYKIRNLAKLEYPKNLVQIIFVDSCSTDSTVKRIEAFIKSAEDVNVQLIKESRRAGKSAALNIALKSCQGDVVIVSDSDCFWPKTILGDAIPYLADPRVGAVSGPKKLLNIGDSYVTKSEASYLNSMNLMKLGESKCFSTLLFEGGFGAFKREVLESFDPYNTGSDDCGTIIRVIEKNFRAIMVPEAEFYTFFPKSLSGKIEMKVRRAGQLTRVFKKYAALLLQGKIRNGRQIIVKYLLSYFLAPFAFLAFIITSLYIMFKIPVTALALLVFLIPKVRNYSFEVSLGYIVILYAMILAVLRKRSFAIWKQPEDRLLLNEEYLDRKGLI